MKPYQFLVSAACLTALASCSTQSGSDFPFGFLELPSDSLLAAASGIPSKTAIGAALDEQDRRVMEQTSPRTVERMDRSEPLTVNDVIKLSQAGVSDETIIHYMDQTSSSYNLSQAQVRRLRDAGVSQRVLNRMLESGS